MSDFRARSSAEILDAAFEIYRRHFTIFLSAGVIATLPMALVQYSALTLGQVAKRSPIGAAAGMSPASLLALQGAVLIAWLVMLVITPFTDAITATTAARAYRGEPVELSDALRVAFARPVTIVLTYWARFGIVVVALMAMGILAAIATVLLPGLAVILVFPMVLAVLALTILVWKRYFAVIPILVVEGTGVRDSMRRSRFLADGYGARIVLLVGGVFVCAIIFSAILAGIASSVASGVVGAILYLFCAALVGQLAGVVVTLLYFDLRIRKEGYDIELLAGALAPSAGASELRAASA